MKTSSLSATAPRQRTFWIALATNMIWINASEIWRYLVIVRPMLQRDFPDQPGIAPFTLGVFASWSVWDTILILAATATYWIYLDWAGRTVRNALLASTAFTITTFGLIWFGVYNMGFVKAHYMTAAVPLAWIEQAIAALIVWWVMGRTSK